jgi:hypothetical protein
MESINKGEGMPSPELTTAREEIKQALIDGLPDRCKNCPSMGPTGLFALRIYGQVENGDMPVDEAKNLVAERVGDIALSCLDGVQMEDGHYSSGLVCRYGQISC